MNKIRLLITVAATAIIAGCTVPGPQIEMTTSPVPTEALDEARGNENYDLAVKYHHGFGSPKNLALAHEHYSKAVAQGDTRALNELGVLLLDRQSVRHDPKKGYRLISQAAELGNSSARYNLGLAHFYGFAGVEQEKSTGFDLIATAAHQGHYKAQSFVVDWITYEATADVDKSAILKERVMELSEDGKISYWDIATLDTNYRSLWERFFETDLQDREKMLSDILAVESGCKDCISDSNFEIARKLKEVETWRSQLDTDADDTARYNLGLAYLNGHGVPTNLEKGATYILKSADNGYVPAQYLLGKIFMEGKGIEKNPGMAYAWFNISAADTWGFREAEWARAMREWSAGYLTPSQISEGQKWSSNWVKGSAWYLGERAQ
ncbi:tetratricopeptide repeat protein [Sulfitobacter sp. R18_1]|uniref:tetratricopeptide repeat protein n=1 Tax=Sulfitobacter sp. R18_1 TaxID=2821104 RepID=UPI001ADBB461|nr:tetratricopeptide repeat protein [Sulfitobacter sp. R18_1]MBO9428400.1 sel1 repeat family protein [Sulfitobacter sp. R18_1]